MPAICKKILLLSIIIVPILSGCSLKKQSSENINPREEKTRRAIDGIYVENKLANLPVFITTLDNNKNAHPISGVEDANLVFEIEVEGGITRLLAVFNSANEIDKIGPIRSARPYILDLANEFDSVYTHCGGSPQALIDIVDKDILSLNEFYYTKYFWRNDKRKSPHNLYTSSENIKNFINDFEITNSNFIKWQFKEDLSKEERATTTHSLKINFKTDEYAINWKYNPENNNYTRFIKGEKETKITAKNIIIQKTTSKVLDNKGRLEIAVIGEGDAIICQDSKCKNIKWQKKSSQERTKFFYNNTQEVEFNAGTTWVEIITQNSKFTISKN